MNKKELRKKYLTLRRKLTKDQIIEKSNQIMQKLFATDEFKAATCVMFYAAFDNEVETKDMINEALKKDKRVVLPKMDTNDKSLILREITNFDNDTTPNRFGISEPKEYCKEVDKNILDLVIVPGIVFDKRGYRIGYGAGYYDRFLKGINKPKIGISYSFQIVNKLPTDENDIKLDKIITEEEVITAEV